MTTVTLLSLLTASNSTLHEAAANMRSYPQILVNVRASNREALDDADVREAIGVAEQQLGATGRILVRPSGTEPLIRIMVEGKDKAQIDRVG